MYSSTFNEIDAIYFLIVTISQNEKQQDVNYWQVIVGIYPNVVITFISSMSGTILMCANRSSICQNGFPFIRYLPFNNMYRFSLTKNWSYQKQFFWESEVLLVQDNYRFSSQCYSSCDSIYF